MTNAPSFYTQKNHHATSSCLFPSQSSRPPSPSPPNTPVLPYLPLPILPSSLTFPSRSTRPPLPPPPLSSRLPLPSKSSRPPLPSPPNASVLPYLPLPILPSSLNLPYPIFPSSLTFPSQSSRPPLTSSPLSISPYCSHSLYQICGVLKLSKKTKQSSSLTNSSDCYPAIFREENIF